MNAGREPKQGAVWVRKSDKSEWMLYEKTAGGRSVIWTLRSRTGVQCEKVSEWTLLRDYVSPRSACEFPDCTNAHHAHGYCMGHLYQLKVYGDASKLRPLHAFAYGPDAVRLEVRSGLKVREINDLKHLGRRVEAADPRETNPANIAARYLVREYAAGRATLKEGELPKPPPKSKARICLAHVGGRELEALTALGNTLTPRNAADRVPAQRALRHLLRAYSAGLLVMNPEQSS